MYTHIASSSHLTWLTCPLKDTRYEITKPPTPKLLYTESNFGAKVVQALASVRPCVFSGEYEGVFLFLADTNGCLF
jgi:hypothetical protein